MNRCRYYHISLLLFSLYNYFVKSTLILTYFIRDDLARAIKKIHALGNGFQVIPVGNRRLMQSVPGELSMDHTTALQLAQVSWPWKLIRNQRIFSTEPFQIIVPRQCATVGLSYCKSVLQQIVIKMQKIHLTVIV